MPASRWTIFLALIGLTASLSGCALLRQIVEPAVPTETLPELGAAPTDFLPQLPSESTAAARPPGLLMADDFSNPLSGWDVRNDPEVITDYRAGEFVIYVGKTDTAIWSKANHNLQDVVIDVDAREVAGPDDNLFGVICRYRDVDNFYRFVISGNGHAGITKRSGGTVTVISAPTLPRTEAVVRGQNANHLRAICQGPQLALYVNGQLVAEASDTDFQDGDVGLLAATGDHPGVEIHFSAFLVTAP